MNKQLWMDLRAVFDRHTGKTCYEEDRFREQIDNQLTLFDLGEKLGTHIPSHHSGTYLKLKEGVALQKFYEGCAGQISYPDDGEQPAPGWYLVLKFPCGPYTFSRAFTDEYPRKTFYAFFEELKSFGAKHVDTANNGLYFTLDVNPSPAREVYKQYDDIFKKYYDMAKEETLAKRIALAEAELAKLREVGK